MRVRRDNKLKCMKYSAIYVARCRWIYSPSSGAPRTVIVNDHRANVFPFGFLTGFFTVDIGSDVLLLFWKTTMAVKKIRSALNRCVNWYAHCVRRGHRTETDMPRKFNCTQPPAKSCRTRSRQHTRQRFSHRHVCTLKMNNGLAAISQVPSSSSFNHSADYLSLRGVCC